MKAGFTMIELLVVIGIIVILASLTIPVYRVVRSNAESVNCLSNLRQMQAANILYANEWRGRFTPIGFLRDTFGTYVANSDWPTNKLFLNLVTDGKVDMNGVSDDQSGQFLVGLICPVTRRISTDVYNTLLRRSYAYNTQDPVYPRRPNTLLGPTMRMPRVSERITFIDAVGWELTNPWRMTFYTSEDRWANQTAGVSLRHSKKANMAFGDGSVRSLPRDRRLEEFNSGLWNPP